MNETAKQTLNINPDDESTINPTTNNGTFDLSSIQQNSQPGNPTFTINTADDTATQLKIAVYSRDFKDHACASIRLIEPMEFLSRNISFKWALKFDPDKQSMTADPGVIEWSDMIIIQRIFPGKDTLEILDKILSSGKPVIYEADDLLWKIPKSNPVHETFQDYIPTIKSILPKVSLITASTEELKKEFQRFNPCVKVLPNLINTENWHSTDTPVDNQRIRIGFAGTATHGEDLTLAEDALLRIASKYGESIQFIFMGFVTSKLKQLPNLEIVQFETYKKYPDVLQSLNLDIAIAPLVDNRFNRCKSNIKWLEYSMAGITGVFSNLPPYNSCVIDGKTGILVGNSSEEWFNALDGLLADRDNCRSIALRAETKVRQSYSLEAAAEQYLSSWKSLFSHSTEIKKNTPDIHQNPPSITVQEDIKTREKYSQWKDRKTLSEGHGQIMAERMLTSWTNQPSFHLLMMINAGEESMLADTLNSLSTQLYNGWGLSIISTQPQPRIFNNSLNNIEWIQDTEAPWEALHNTINETAADWVMYLLPGDQFEPHSLFSFADYINQHPDWCFVYSDEDVLDQNGQSGQANFKPDFNLDLMRSSHYIGHSCIFKRDVMENLGGFTNLAFVTNEDMAFKILDTCGEAGIGHIADILFHSSSFARKNPNTELRIENGRIVRYEHLLRNGINAEVLNGSIADTFRIQYNHDDNPLVSIIIPTKDRPDLIIACIDSILEKTAYSNYEIIVVDNDSEVDDVHDYYEKLEHEHGDRLRVLHYDHPFNFSAMNNLAVKQACGEFVLLLNNDTQVLHENWLNNLIDHGMRPEVGIVGARLIYPDKRLQHAGVVLGQSPIAAHPYNGESMDKSNPVLSVHVDRNYSAVTAACMLIKKTLYQEIGGLDEVDLRVLYNDVEFCLKVGNSGYKIVWTPYTTLAHNASTSLNAQGPSDEKIKRSIKEYETMLSRWLPQIANDPAINRNLCLQDNHLSVESELVPGWDTKFHDKPRILGFPLDGLGCGYYRVYAPLWALEKNARAQIAFVPEHDRHVEPRIPSIEELERLAPDTVFLQSTLKDNQLIVLERYKQFSQSFKVFDLDDLKTQVPDSSSNKPFIFKDIKHRLRKGLSFCDRLIVSTEPLKNAYEHLIDDVIVVPNRLEKSRWINLEPERNKQEKPRVGWVGAQQHQGDLKILIDVIKATYREIDWVFFGMCLNELRPYIAEEHDFVAPNEYPAKMASLKLDLAVAPLEQHAFNEAKSNLRLLEYGILGWPVVCTDIYPYQNAPVDRVANETNQWIEAIMDHVKDRKGTRKKGIKLRNWVLEKWILDNQLDEWLQALTS